MRKAFTLIELVVAIVLISIFVISVFGVFRVGLTVWGSGLDRAHLRQDSHAAVQRMTRELSQTNSITSAAAAQITFLADLDDNGSDETVSYSLSGGNVLRAEGSVTTVLARSVQSLGFTYTDLNNTVLTPPGGTDSQAERDTIRVIGIALGMAKNNETFNLSASIHARNQ